MERERFYSDGLEVLQNKGVAYSDLESVHEAEKIAKAANDFYDLNGREHKSWMELETFMNDR